MIGSFGDLVFIASAEEIRTFRDFKRSSGARWGVHDVHGSKPRPEYIGPSQDSISFSMRFDVRYGMNPRVEMDNLLAMAREGKVETLTIGGKGLGVNKWYIESVNQEWTTIDNKGNILTGTIDLTLKEYV